MIRLATVEKIDQLSSYTYEPDGKPIEGSTQFFTETIYLVRKNEGGYCRIFEYEMVNTELRTLLFMHSYGYIQSIADFGNIRRYLEYGEQRRLAYLSATGSNLNEINLNLQDAAPKVEYKGQNHLLYRKFTLLRVSRIFKTITQPSSPSKPASPSNMENVSDHSVRKLLE